eukprot:scaffold9768_cov82-Skeletonema_marinoi.AAC.1
MSAMSGTSASERSAAWERGPESPPDGITSAARAAADAAVVVATSLFTKALLDVRETMGGVDRACATSGSATARSKDRFFNFIGRPLQCSSRDSVYGRR